ncbi:Bifunctional inhibitor/plant lipid transfer protein/seed storage helical domain [Dillenia turbinata]|uniref:Bifunctional inhibitor/plant lipid transfer protein/seed storage helical domain n=1 Tax=Dillenia turbinata TaxID=194707 RepID=A0AAN8VVQ4_9MAGN
MATSLLLLSMLVMTMDGHGTSDFFKDKDKCATEWSDLGLCLPFVGGDTKSPTVDCCSRLKLDVEKAKKCFCAFVEYRENPNLGLTINATLALSLPDACHRPMNVSECPDLLYLDPYSEDAKVFEDATALASPTTP